MGLSVTHTHTHITPSHAESVIAMRQTLQKALHLLCPYIQPKPDITNREMKINKLSLTFSFSHTEKSQALLQVFEL